MTDFDYNTFKRDTLDAVKHIGTALPTRNKPVGIKWLTAEQLRHLRGRNICNDEVWQYRLLADCSILVEIAYGWMMDTPLLGLTVYHKDPSSRDWDHERSKACFTIAELVDALQVLNAGREAVA